MACIAAGAQVSSWHMAGIFGAAAKLSLVWGTADLRGRYDVAERINLYRQAAMELDISDALEPIRARRASRIQDA